MNEVRIPQYPTQEIALNSLKIFLMNEMPNECLAVVKQWPVLMPLLPESLKAQMLPDKVTSKTPTSINIEIYLAKIVTLDKDMLDLKARVKILAPLDDAVLIQGETGTGKELIAKALHGARDPAKFIDINCAGLPEYLVESELFGHKKGAFTGADTDKKGLLEEANDGTVFLDEIGDLPIALQAKFLRAIQEKVVRPVGANQNRKISCRIVAASKYDLNKLVDAGKFRDDLCARLKTFELHTKPIRDRLGDIPEIIKVLDTDSSSHEMWSKVDWGKINLKDNYRALQRIVRRWVVLKERPMV